MDATCVYILGEIDKPIDSAKSSRGTFTIIDKDFKISSMNMLNLRKRQSVKGSWNINELFRERNGKWQHCIHI